MPAYVPLSNVERVILVSKTYNPASVAANTVADNATTVTITGAALVDHVIAIKPTTDAGLAVVGARVSAADTVTVTFANTTGSAIDPASETWKFLFFRSAGTLPDSIS